MPELALQRQPHGGAWLQFSYLTEQPKSSFQLVAAILCLVTVLTVSVQRLSTGSLSSHHSYTRAFFMFSV